VTDRREPVAVVPAAGASSRFGSMKLLADVNGMPMIGRTLASLFGAGLGRVVVVVAPAHQLGASGVLDDPRVTVLTNPEPSRGMFSSIQIGLAAADGDPVVVLPADMPFLRTETIADVMEECGRLQVPVVPVYRGKRGHPLVLPRAACDRLLGQSAGTTLKQALLDVAGAPHERPTNDRGAVRDVDTPQDLEN
jgi:molybdenum cofactor cytidylyltransferase